VRPDARPRIGHPQLDRSTSGGIDLTVRYDDALAAQLGLDENVLKLWKYQDGQWQRIYDGFERHPDLHILTGHTDGTIEYFAVSAPEPGAASLLLIGGAFAALRRRSRNRSAAWTTPSDSRK
jgi:hypothetical protein